SSGQTVYVEPMETIEQNNELVRLLDEEMAEVHRILLEMTKRIGEHAPALQASQEVLAEVELQFAKARFAEDYGCVAPTLSSPDLSSRRNSQDLSSRARNVSSESRDNAFDFDAKAPKERHRNNHGELAVHNAIHPVLERNLRN